MYKAFVVGMTLSAAACLPGCLTVYTPEVQQGNVVTQEMIDKLKPGMTRGQVRYILGTPLITDPFHQDRWDYYYSFKKDRKTPVETLSLIILFKKDALAEIQGNTRIKDNNPAATPPPFPHAESTAPASPVPAL